MGSRADTLLNSLSTLTLSGKIEQLSEAECQERIKYHQEKAQKLLEDAQSVCGQSKHRPVVRMQGGGVGGWGRRWCET